MGSSPNSSALPLTAAIFLLDGEQHAKNMSAPCLFSSAQRLSAGSAGPVSFHFAFWPGIAFGVIKTVEAATGTMIFPEWINIGSGKYADDLGINVYGLAFCTGAYLVGALLFSRRGPAVAPSS